MRYKRGCTCGIDHGFPHGKWYACTLRGRDLEVATEDGRRRDGRNVADRYKNDFAHPMGQDRAHLVGNCAEYSVALGLGLPWTGKGQKGKELIDVGHGTLLPVQVKGTEKPYIGLRLTKHDKVHPVQCPYILVQVHVYPDQVCCYPVGWQWRSKIPHTGLQRADLRDMKELLDELERRRHGADTEAAGAATEESRGE